ncbi:MAG: 16S rRNA (uracil(1498)-N(3))-methyltransferase [Mangrovibacterium sp.]
MHLFYTPNITGTVYVLPEEESKHAIRVLRMQEGDKLRLIDGIGGFYEASILEANQKRCQIQVEHKIENFSQRNNYLHIAVAPTKNIDRMEWFLEKATEIGIDEITPILCAHSERKVIKTDRLEKIIVSAMKQSYKAFLPKLNPLMPLKDLLATDFDGGKFIAHCYDGEKRLFKQSLDKEKNLILIGPEGDFTEDEVQQALTNEFLSVSLGKSRLRTETAALAACHTVSVMLDE